MQLEFRVIGVLRLQRLEVEFDPLKSVKALTTTRLGNSLRGLHVSLLVLFFEFLDRVAQK